MRFGYNTFFVIARRERSERRGNPSCLGGDDPVSLFVYCNTVDRHRLSALAMTGWGKEFSVRFEYRTNTFVIARRERSERRGNPLYLGGDDPVSLFVYCNTVDRHGLSALAMTRWGKESSVRFEYRTNTFVIARRERSERRGNQSCLGGDDPVSLFVYCNTVNRHGLLALAMT